MVGITDHADYDADQIKEIAEIVEGGVSAESQLLMLAWWLKEQYGSTMNQALKTVLPVKQKVNTKEQKVLRLLIPDAQLEAVTAEAEKKSYKARVRLFKALKENHVIPSEVASGQLNLSAATLKPVIAKGYVALELSLIHIWLPTAFSGRRLITARRLHLRVNTT